ncbi:hypothetical protein NUM3379_34370 [Kineococcus sp. NUM-3379]
MSLLAKLRSGGAGRVVWNLGDQVVCSVNNALLFFLIANAFPAAGSPHVGAFAIAFVAYVIGIGVTRALATMPLGIRFAGEPPERFRPAAAGALGTSLLLGVVGGAASAVVGWTLGGALGAALLALGAALPALLLQDSWRQVLLALKRPAAALATDTVFLLLQIAALVLLMRSEHGSVAPFVLAWGAAALLASLLGVLQLRLLPRPASARRWVLDQWSVTRYLVPEFVLQQLGVKLVIPVVAFLSTLGAASALRAGESLTSPATIVAGGLLSFAIPELSSRRHDLGVRGWRLAATAVSGLVVLTGLAWGAVVLLLPDTAGTWLLEGTWEGAEAVLLPIVVGQAGAAAAVGPAAALYAMDRAAVTFRINGVYALLALVFSAVGAVLDGAPGAAWGGAAAFWLVVPWWFLAVRRESAAVVAARAGGQGDPSPSEGAGAHA